MSTDVLKADAHSIAPKRGPQRDVFLRLGDRLTTSGGWTALGASSKGSDQSQSRAFRGLPTTAQLLTDGGDSRIVCAPGGSNRYGCCALPEPDVLAYGSSTASTISPAGFAAADALRDRLAYFAPTEAAPVTYEREVGRLRRELKVLCGLEKLSGLEIIFGASGTDLHLFASQLMVDTAAPPPLIVRVEAGETGRGVPDALAGCHFGDSAALGDAVVPNVPLDCGRPLEVLEVKCRNHDGTLRSAAAVDAEVEEAVLKAVKARQRVLITLVDVSKTGLLAPSPGCVRDLRHRFPESIEVLVDACQFRLAPSTLQAYLQHDFLVAITGSKFITGPTFCGALLVPQNAARRLATRTLPRALRSYSARADWPSNWAARIGLKEVENYGLLLRWEAALSELRAFRQLPEAAIRDFLETFAQAVMRHIARSPAFELLPLPALDRGAIAAAKSWDQLPTIFSFLLTRPSSSRKPTWLNQNETKRVHELMREDLRSVPGVPSNTVLSPRCQIGQPVACGTREGIPVSALRLCASSRLVVDAVSSEGRGAKVVIAEALAVLDKAAFLATLPLT
jgi:hypothetical protein